MKHDLTHSTQTLWKLMETKLTILFNMNNVQFDLITLKFSLECHCGYDLNHLTDKLFYKVHGNE